MKIQVVVGAQYGSEAKGHVAAQLAMREIDEGRIPAIVRVAGPNAGHSVVDPRTGNKWAFRSVPVGAVLPGTLALAIAAGSEIDPTVLFTELDALREAGIRYPATQMLIDPEATILTSDHITTETGMHERMGSTGKGIGAARADRIMRTASRLVDEQWLVKRLRSYGITVGRVAETLRQAGHIDTVIIEGTQGYGLGLHMGHYPQCTSSDCRAIDFLGMVGLSPWDADVTDLEVWAATRVFPIRVAGNSGYLAGETSWEALGLPEERTTVTKKVRRVGAWDPELVRDAVTDNGGSPVVRLALTMTDQLDPTVAGETKSERLLASGIVRRFIARAETDANASVQMVTTSDRTAVWL